MPHQDSPFATTKQNKWSKLPFLPNLIAEIESSSEESDEYDANDVDFDSDEDEQSRILKSECLNSPELLREAAAFPKPSLLDSIPSLKERKKTSSIRNLKKLLEKDEGDPVKVMASTLLDGHSSEVGNLDFIPDISSVDRGEETNHLIVTSEPSGTLTRKMDVLLDASANQKSDAKIKKISTPVEGKGPMDGWQGLSSIHSSAAGGSLLVPRPQREILTDEEFHSSSQEIFPGTPQNHTSLTLGRMQRSADKAGKTLPKQEIEPLEEIAGNKESISNDHIIIIESQDNPSEFPSDTSVTSFKLCEFPVGKKDTVTVSVKDFATLELGTFLNDIIIDFYLTILRHNLLPNADQESVHVFNTMFYKRLIQTPKKDGKKKVAFEMDPTLSIAEKQHLRVAGWTKDFDLFKKDLVVIPICQDSHWFLLVVVKPGSILQAEGEGSKLEEPFIIVLDSLGGGQNSAVRNIRNYLAWEWKKKKCIGEDPQEEFSFTSKEMRAIQPDVPKQDNGSDCGIFLLHYVEKIFQNMTKFCSPNLPILSDWFSMEEVGQKRGDIAELIKQLTNEQNPNQAVTYPDIEFTAARQLRSKPNPTLAKSDNKENSKKKQFYSQHKRSNGNSNAKLKTDKAAKKIQGTIKKPSILMKSPFEARKCNGMIQSPRIRNKPRYSSGLKEDSSSSFMLDLLFQESPQRKQNKEKSETSLFLSELEHMQEDGIQEKSELSLVDSTENKSKTDINDVSDINMSLQESLHKSLLLLSPGGNKLETTHDRLSLPSDSSALYRSPDLSLKPVKSMKKKEMSARLRDKINQPVQKYFKRKVPSESSLSSSGEISNSETSGELFTPAPGMYNFQRVSCRNENEIKIATTKRFKLASGCGIKSLKNSRYNEPKSEIKFDRFLFGEPSKEDSDIFDQNN